MGAGFFAFLGAFTAEPALATPPVESPATIPVEQASLSLKEQIAANERALVEVPAPKADPPAPVVDEKQAEAEANSTKPDAELSEAGKTLRANRLDARKAKLQTEITELNELLRQRKELREHIAAVAPVARQDPPAASRPAVSSDPRDPEPTFDQYQQANPTDPDPYAGWVTEKARWAVRQDMRAAAVTRHQQQAQHSASQAVASYQTRADEMRGHHSDFDAVTQPFLEKYASHPYASAVAAFLASDADGPRVLYHVAKHPDAEAALFAAGSHPLIAIGELKATVKTALVKTKPITSAPTPPSQTAGAGATATHDDPNSRSTKDHLRIRAQEDAERRVRGVR